MARLTAFAMAASILCAGVARAQPQAAVQDLGNGIHAAIGVAVGTGGGADARRVAVPQSNTFLVVTPMAMWSSTRADRRRRGPSAAARQDQRGAAQGNHPDARSRRPHRRRGSLVPARRRHHRAAGLS